MSEATLLGLEDRKKCKGRKALGEGIWTGPAELRGGKQAFVQEGLQNRTDGPDGGKDEIKWLRKHNRVQV